MSEHYNSTNMEPQKAPYLILYLFAFFGFIAGLLLILTTDKIVMAFIVLGCSLLCLAIAIMTHLSFVVTENEVVEATPTIATPVFSYSEPLNKPLLDFFSDNSEVNDTFIKNLLIAQKAITPSFAFAPYDGLENERVLGVEKDLKARSFKVFFESTKYYKTIKKYVQQNYNKIPVYSDLKSKSKTTSKVYRLTTSVLESLHNEFIENEHLYMGIIVGLDSSEYVPYHFFYRALFSQYTMAQEYIQAKIEKLQDCLTLFERQIDRFISITNAEIEAYENLINKISSRINKLNNKKAKNGSLSPRKESLLSNLTTSYNNLDKAINYYRVEQATIKNKLVEQKLSTSNDISNLNKHSLKMQQKYQLLLSQYKPLGEALDYEGFVPLNRFLDIEYKKIIGCYIIRNKENGRCYVGQSKDVFKRIKQHFKGTEPNNIIFAEDYFLSTNKDDLFEFQIIPCSTKDELDSTEKALIETYDAFNSGYNGTHGNS